MFVYYILPFVVLLLGGITKTRLKNNKIFFCFVLFVVLFLFMGLRSPDIGSDVPTYVSIFKKLSVDKFESHVFGDKGMYLYSIYNILLSYISTDPQTILIGNAFIICLLFVIFLYRVCNKHIVFSAVLFTELYFYYSAFNISRQFIAILLISNALYYIINNDGKTSTKVKFILICIAAFFVHNTSIFALVLLPFLFIDKKYYLKYSIIIMIIFAISMFLMEYIVTAFFKDYYSYFEEDSLFNFSNSTTNGRMAFVYIVYLLLIFFVVYLFKNKMIYDDGLNFMIAISLFATIISLVFVKNALTSRIIIYFQIPIVFVIPYVLDGFEKKYKLIIAIGVLLLLFIPFYIRVSGNYSGIVEYHFFWEGNSVLY